MAIELARMLAELSGEDPAAVAARVDAGLAAARERWPAAPAPDASFTDFVMARARRQPDALARLRIDDLVLAWWASGKGSQAIAAFEATFQADLAALLRRFHALDGDELRQRLRVKLFVDEPPRILDYGGFGFLQNWLKVVATRTFLDVARSRQRERTDDLSDVLLAQVADDRADPRAAAQHAQILGALKRALARAIADLPRRDRTFLRHVAIDQLSIQQIAEMYAVHRVTVSRALAAAHARVREATRDTVAAELKISAGQVASAIRALDSRIEVSLDRIFRDIDVTA